MNDLMLKLLGSPIPLRVVLARKIIQSLGLFSYRDRLALGAVDRPHYGHCIFEAAKLASRLKYPKISVIEFGCGGGNGLASAERHILEAQNEFSVQIELYGFDTGGGLPPPQDYRDFPHYFKTKLYRMDYDDLMKKLKIAKLVIGDVRDTARTFFTKYDPAPIGCIFHDLDFYSSTSSAFTIFEADHTRFMPRVCMYFDDVTGDNTWLVNEFAGELLAIDEFNSRHQLKKITVNRCAPSEYWAPNRWANQIYTYHDFSHPRYAEYVADPEQAQLEAVIAPR